MNLQLIDGLGKILGQVSRRWQVICLVGYLYEYVQVIFLYVLVVGWDWSTMRSLMFDNT